MLEAVLVVYKSVHSGIEKGILTNVFGGHYYIIYI